MVALSATAEAIFVESAPFGSFRREPRGDKGDIEARPSHLPTLKGRIFFQEYRNSRPRLPYGVTKPPLDLFNTIYHNYVL
jgi:hypothetical protein